MAIHVITHGGKNIHVVGVGWAHQGTANEKSVPSAYITGHGAYVNVTGGYGVRGTCKNHALGHTEVVFTASD